MKQGDLPANLRIRPGVIGLDRLDPAVWEAVQQGARYWPGTVEVTSVGRHAGDKGNHSGGHAVDVRLYDEAGKPLSNFRDGGKHARDYEKFWQNGVALASEAYPDLPARARWGGNFYNSVGADYMHLDTTPGRATAGGNLLGGATPAMLRKWGGQSEGIVGGDWAAHREFLRTGKQPASLGATLAQAGNAVLNAIIPAAQAEEAPVDNPFADLPEVQAATGDTAMDNPFASLPEVQAVTGEMPVDNPFASLPEVQAAMDAPAGAGDAGPGTAIAGPGLSPEELQMAVPPGQFPDAGKMVQGPQAILPQAPLPQPLPPSPNQRIREGLRTIGPLGEAAAGWNVLPPDPIEEQQALEDAGDSRPPARVIDDLRDGAPGLSPDEFQRVQSAIERGDLPDDPKSLRNLFAVRLPARAMTSLDEAIATNQDRREMQDAGQLGGLFKSKLGSALLQTAADEASLGLSRAAPMTGDVGLNRRIKTALRAMEIDRQKTLENDPALEMGARIAGGLAPYALGLKGLRTLRTAAGLPAVGPGVLGQVAEGAQLGGPMEFLRKPQEGSDTAFEDFQRRLLQSGAGVAVGALLDAGLGGTGEALGLARRAMKDTRSRKLLEQEAKSAGFTDPKEYMDSLFKRVETPEGPIAVPSRDIINGRPAGALEPPSSSTLSEPQPAATLSQPEVPALPAPVRESAEPAAPVRDAAAIRTEAEGLERSAAAVEDKTARDVLLAEAALRRREADALEQGAKPKRNRADVQRERARERVTVNEESDDLITAIRKLGGINVDLESDWQGRLSHLNKRAIGLAGVERTGGKGRSLDDLAEALQERGYLQSRDKRELEARLSQAETGAPQWSYHKSGYQGPDRPPVERRTGEVVTSDGLVSFRDVPENQDWIIDPESGSVFASRPIDEGELIDIEIGIKRDEVRRQQEDEWFRREQAGAGDTVRSGEQRASVQDDGGDGVPERVAREIPGRSGDQSGQDQAGLFGGLSEAEKAQADKLELEELQKEKARQRNAANSPPADEGLFSLDNRQADMLDEPQQSIIDQAAEIFARPASDRISEKDRAILQKGVAVNLREAIEDIESGKTFADSGITFVRDGDLSKAMRKGLVLGSFKYRVEARTRSSLLEVMKSNLPSGDGGTLYANPIGAVARNLAADIKEAPARAAVTALAGGTLAGLNSKEEPGTAKWWRDVIAGGVVLQGGLTALRRGGVVGKGQYFDRLLFDRIGGWVSGIPLIGQGPVFLRDLKRDQQGTLARMNRQTGNIGNFLLKHFTPAERAQMSDLIEGRGIAPEMGRVHQQAKALDEYLTDVGQKLKDIGMLPEDMELGGYLHRYYAKHLGMSKLFREAKSQSISGTWSLARGTNGDFGREYLSPGARAVVDEFEALQQQIDVIEKQKRKLERQSARSARKGQDAMDFKSMEDLDDELKGLQAQVRELRKREFAEFIGDENGKAKSFIFTPDEVGRVDAGSGQVKIYPFKPAAGEQAIGKSMPVAELPELFPSERKWSLRGTKGGQVTLHRDWTPTERKAWGEIRDAGYRYVRGLSESTHDLSLGMMFQKIGKNREWVKDTDPGGWVAVPTTKVGKGSPVRKYGALAGQYVRPDVWRGINRYGRSVLGNSVPAKVYKAALAKWKVWHTADSPLSHFNNMNSNVQMLLLAGKSPTLLAESIKVLREGEKSKFWREAADDGLFGTDFTSATLSAEGDAAQSLMDLAEALRTQPEIPDATVLTSLMMDVKSWWHESGQHLREAKGPKAKGQAVAGLLNKPAKVAAQGVQAPYSAYAKTMRKAYKFEDNLFKMAVYLGERKAGKTSVEAVEEAERYFFDYYDVPDIVRYARDLPIGSPFISYTYLAAKTMLKTAVQNPERLIALMAANEALNYAAMRMNENEGQPGEYWKLMEAEDSLSAPWDRGRTLFGMKNTVHLPSPDGYRIALGNAHVMGNPMQSETGGREQLPALPLIGKVWGSSIFGGSPLHALLDVAISEDWKGKKIWEKYDTDQDKITKSLAYLYRAWAPSTPVFPGSYHQTKILEGLAGDAAAAKREGKNSLAAPIVSGANAIAEALGFQQLTGKDRMNNLIDTKEAALASIGIKLRPPGYDQTLDFELGKLQKERQEIKAEFRKQSRDAAEMRYTDAQLRKFQDQFWEKMQDVQKREDALFDARKTLKAAGFRMKPGNKKTLQ